METTKIQCPNCNASIEIMETAESASCPECGRIILIERVAVPFKAPEQAVVKQKSAPEVPLSRDDKLAGLGLAVLLAAVLAVFFGLNLKIYLLWLAGGLLTAAGIGLSLIGLKGDRKERFAASMIVGFIALFFILMGILAQW